MQQRHRKDLAALQSVTVPAHRNSLLSQGKSAKAEGQGVRGSSSVCFAHKSGSEGRNEHRAVQRVFHRRGLQGEQLILGSSPPRRRLRHIRNDAAG